MDETVGVVYQVMGGIFCVTYFLSTFIIPFLANAPFRPYSMLHFHRLSVATGAAAISTVDIFAHACYFVLRWVTAAILFPLARSIFDDKTFHRWYMRTAAILPGEYKHLRAWRAKASSDSADEIDTSQMVQEEAVLWLSQMPLDPSESKTVVSSLALIPSSHPHRFPKPVIVFLNLTLESLLREGIGQSQTDIAINCVLVLGHIKFQSAVDRNVDRNHNAGGTPVTASVAWAAQKLTINAFQDRFNTSQSEGIRVRLLTATAWLSPVKPMDDVYGCGGEKLEIQGRDRFIQELGIILQSHIHGEKVLDNEVLINLIHGMHASIRRGDYGDPSSTMTFPPALCEDYDSPWSEDESVLRALITYATDILSPSTRRWALVEREIKFDELASELIDTLMVNTTSTDVVVFGFWVVYRVPYAFGTRKTMLTDLGHIWTSAADLTQDDTLRRRLDFHAVDALARMVQWHVSTSGVLPKLPRQTALKFLNAALESEYSRPMTTYLIAMILNLGKSTQVAAVTNEIKPEPFMKTLFSVNDDLESGTTKEDDVDLRIYSTLILLKLRPVAGLDVGRVKGLIERMERTIGDPSGGDSGSGTDAGADPDRVRWKAIYLSGLLSSFVPDDTERENHIKVLQRRVRALVGSGGGELPAVADYGHCLRPLGMQELKLMNPAAEQQGQISTAFKMWLDGFPLFPLAGSVASAKTQE